MTGNWQRTASNRDPNQANLIHNAERAVERVRQSLWSIPEGAEHYRTYAEVLRRVPQNQARERPDPISHASKDECLLIFERLSNLYMEHVKKRDLGFAHIIEDRILKVFDKLDDIFGIPRLEESEVADHIQSNGYPPNWRELI